MFKKVLIADDLGSINSGVASVLNDLDVNEVIQVHYCDDAYLKIKSASLNTNPIELLITDLSFIPDHREQNFSSGEELVKILKKEHPELKVIVYSVEDATPLIKRFMNDFKIEGFVCKGRNGLIELKEAVESVSNNQTYLSPQLKALLNKKEHQEIDDYDIELLRLMSLGKSQVEISTFLKGKNISPSGLSSIEKRLNRLRVNFKASNAIHLVSIAKDMGLI